MVSTETHPLRVYRRAERIKARSLAGAIGIDRTTLHRYENGKLVIPAERVLDIERITGISRRELRPDVFGPPVSAKANATG